MRHLTVNCCAQRLRYRIYLTSTCLIVATCVVATLQAGERSFVRDPQNESEARIAAALDEQTQLDFVETPLSDSLDFMKDLHKIQIQVDKKVIEDTGIGVDLPVTANLRGISFGAALRLILSDLSLTYVVRDEVLLITSDEEAERMVEVRVHNVADLVELGLTADELVETLEDLVPDESHDAKKNGAKSVRALKTLLIVRDSPMRQRNIAKLLVVLCASLDPKAQTTASQGVQRVQPATTLRRSPTRAKQPSAKKTKRSQKSDENPFGESPSDERNPFKKDANPFEEAADGKSDPFGEEANPFKVPPDDKSNPFEAPPEPADDPFD